jgi:hypothetical protein
VPKGVFQFVEIVPVRLVGSVAVLARHMKMDGGEQRLGTSEMIGSAARRSVWRLILSIFSSHCSKTIALRGSVLSANSNAAHGIGVLTKTLIKTVLSVLNLAFKRE